MTVDLTRLAPATLLGTYPGMPAAEARVWERFLLREGSTFEGFLYNVRVGNPPPAPAGAEENFRKMWADINATRIDAIGVRTDELVVFEVKVNAGLGAIGQALAAQILLVAEIDDRRSIDSTIVSDGFRPDVLTVAASLNIDTIQV